MILKEAYRYQNFLTRMINEAENLLETKKFITTTTERHHVKDSDPQQEDKTITLPKLPEVEFSPSDVLELFIKLLDEKEKLSNAISKAKKEQDIDIDAAIAMNVKYQKFIGILTRMSNIKSSNEENTTVGYRINATSGSQETFRYTVNSTTSIDYNRNTVRGLLSKYTKKTDEVSAKIDLLELTVEVDYQIPENWDITSTFEELF